MKRRCFPGLAASICGGANFPCTGECRRPVFLDPTLEDVAQMRHSLPGSSHLKKMVEMRERPDTAVDIGALVLGIQDDNTNFVRAKTAVFFIKKIWDNQRRGEHPALQFGDAGQFIRTEAPLYVDQMRDLRPAVQDQQIWRIGFPPATVRVQAKRAIERRIVHLNEFARSLGDRQSKILCQHDEVRIAGGD